ncbi:MAG TPA: hypothetical protein VIL99_10185 [Ignavibacteria bacterium]
MRKFSLYFAGAITIILFLLNFSFEPRGYYDVRPLSEINSENNPDAYPWISSDGLRMYYTSGKRTKKSSNEKIYYTERQSTGDSFGEPKKIKLWKDESNIVSCWLSEDELNIYYKFLGIEKKIYRASRSSRKELFDSVKAINLEGDFGGTNIGPSLTPDKKELYIYNYIPNEKLASILIFKYEEEFKYNLDSKLLVPPGYTVFPGQLSRDGLKYYLSMEKDSVNRLYYFKRNSLNEKFSKLYKVGGEINNYTLTQVSLTADENILIFSCSETKKWSNNELYAAFKRGDDEEPVEF